MPLLLTIYQTFNTMLKSAIYIISSQLFPERKYIGSAKNLRTRKNRHIRELTKKCHPNKKLQYHANKYGINDLHFSILLKCPFHSLLFWEQQFINYYKPWFNICPIAGSRAGTTQTTATRLKISKRIREHPNPNPANVLRRYV